ncbi:hypothetical protein L7F22_042546 [Adiantum nelumboides]|nr:hypothetical protein [Adiantum nelumboides]
MVAAHPPLPLCTIFQGFLHHFVALMFNCVKRDEIQDYSPYDDGKGCRSRTWLFLAYVISFVSLVGSFGLLIQDALVNSAASSWTGMTGVLQCVFILASGIIYWTSRTGDQ